MTQYDDCQVDWRAAPGHAAEHGHPDHAPHRGHDHAHATGTRRLALALAVTATFMLAEVVGGILSNSVALLADAGHMLTDAGALGLSLFVAWFSRRPATPQRTYGSLRWEILAALINGAVLLAISGWIAWEAVQRLRTPEPIASGLMLTVAVLGLGANGLSAWLLHGSKDHSLNLKGAYLHVLSDLLGSVAVITAALVIRYTGWLAADALASMAVTALIVRAAWRLVREAVEILLEGTPAHIDVTELRGALEGVAGVRTVHDLHVWTLTSGVVAMSAHAIAPDPALHQAALADLHAAAGRFGIRHTTIQLEGEPLEACCRELVQHSPTPATP